MDCIEHSICSKPRSDCGWLKLSGDFGVVGPTKLSKLFNRVILAYFESHCWSWGQLINHLLLFWQKFIRLVEFLGSSVIEPNHLHGADFEAVAEDEIDDLSDKFCLDCMRLDDAKCAVFIVRPGFDHCLAREDEVDFSFCRGRGITAVAGVFGSVLSIQCSEGFGSFFSCLLRISRTNEFSPLRNCVLGDQLHPNWKIRSHKVYKRRIEAFSLVLTVELASWVLIELEHFEIGNGELFLGSCDHFAEIKICVGLKHSVSPEWRWCYLLEVSSPTSSFLVN